MVYHTSRGLVTYCSSATSWHEASPHLPVHLNVGELSLVSSRLPVGTVNYFKKRSSLAQRCAVLADLPFYAVQGIVRQAVAERAQLNHP